MSHRTKTIRLLALNFYKIIVDKDESSHRNLELII